MPAIKACVLLSQKNLFVKKLLQFKHIIYTFGNPNSYIFEFKLKTIMKRVSILLIVIGIISIFFAIYYFRPALNPVDSDPMTVNPSGVRTSEWPIFIGILTTFVGVCFYFISTSAKAKK